MKKNLGIQPAVFPMPVLMIATYDERGKTDVMNAAWGMLCQQDKVALFISENHKTTRNIHLHKAFTVALADEAHRIEADYFGIASGNNLADKFERTGLHAVKSEFVHAPVIEEFPVTMECVLDGIVDTESMHAIVGRIVNTVADEAVLSESGQVDPLKLKALIFDKFQRGYYTVGNKVGDAYSDGRQLL